MTGKGNLTLIPNRNMKVILVLQLFWLVLQVMLAWWWGHVMLHQAQYIGELESRLQIASGPLPDWARTQRMLFWESISFFILWLLTTAALLFLYFRDLKRQRGLQAFFASVTHELRTPLTSIRLQAESIAEAVATSHDKILVERLLEDTTRLEAQVERTLELARVEGGGSVFTQPFQLKPWLERWLQNWAENTASKLSVHADIKECTVQIDPASLQIILKNLFENTQRHAVREKGAVEVRLRTEVQAKTTALIYEDNGEAVYAEPQKLGTLFYRGKKSQGAGVGLYLIRMLMERMGGKVRLAGPSETHGFQATLEFKNAAEAEEGGTHS